MRKRVLLKWSFRLIVFGITIKCSLWSLGGMYSYSTGFVLDSVKVIIRVAFYCFNESLLQYMQWVKSGTYGIVLYMSTNIFSKIFLMLKSIYDNLL